MRSALNDNASGGRRGGFLGSLEEIEMSRHRRKRLARMKKAARRRKLVELAWALFLERHPIHEYFSAGRSFTYVAQQRRD